MFSASQQLGLFAARDGLHDIALCLKIVSDQQSDIDLVLNDQNARRRDEPENGPRALLVSLFSGQLRSHVSTMLLVRSLWMACAHISQQRSA